MHISIKFETHVETNQMFVMCVFFFIARFRLTNTNQNWNEFFFLQSLSHRINSSVPECECVPCHAMSCVLCLMCRNVCRWILSNISMDKHTRHTHKTDEWKPKRYRARCLARDSGSMFDEQKQAVAHEHYWIIVPRNKVGFTCSMFHFIDFFFARTWRKLRYLSCSLVWFTNARTRAHIYTYSQTMCLLKDT